MYFAPLLFNKNQHVKLKFPDEELEDYDVISWTLIPEKGSLNMGLLVGGEFMSRQLLGLYVQIIS